MSRCINHPDRITDYVCRNCGRAFCGECLIEIGDYYYCHNNECRKAAHQEVQAEFSHDEIKCPVCSNSIKVFEDQQLVGLIHCPECNTAINLELEKPDIMEPKEYTQLFSSVNQGDIAIVKSLLNEVNIDYYVLDENFLTLSPLLQPARFFVLNSQVEEAKEMLKDFEPHIFGVSSRSYEGEEEQ